MIEQLKFYMFSASPELLAARREYIERVIVGKLRAGIENMGQWSPEFLRLPDSAELLEKYRSGLEFFTKNGFK